MKKIVEFIIIFNKIHDLCFLTPSMQALYKSSGPCANLVLSDYKSSTLSEKLNKMKNT